MGEWETKERGERNEKKRQGLQVMGGLNQPMYAWVDVGNLL